MEVSKSLIFGDLKFKYVCIYPPKLGLIVSRHYGNAVSRNLFKRRCRSLFRTWFINKDLKVVLIVRPIKQNISFIDMDSAFRRLYEKIYT